MVRPGTASGLADLPYPWAVAAATLLGFSLRLVLLDRFPLREDEALYGYWALHFWYEDPFFLSVWPDKPPLFIWLLATVFHFLGPEEASGRWLNVVASSLTIPVVAATARHIWDRSAGGLAALALALSPFAISFAPTLYTDPLLVLWGSLAVYAAVRARAFGAGLWLAAALMTKQQGVLYLPLVVGVLASRRKINDEGLRTGDGGRQSIDTRHLTPFTFQAFPFLAGLAVIVLPILGWDSLRWSVAPSPWDLGAANYGGLALVPITAWPQRLVAWAELAWHLTASWAGWAGLGLGVLWAAVQATKDEGPRSEDRRSPYHALFGVSRILHQVSRPGRLLALWVVGFLALHLVTSVQVWDRYLLPLVPALALGFGWLGARLGRSMRAGTGVAGMAWLILVLPAAVTAAQGGLPIGGDHGDYDGLGQALAWLEENAPAGAILYHQTLGWHYQFYLYGHIGPGGYDLRWFPSTVYLADNAAKMPHRRKFLIQPDWAPLRDAGRRLAMRGLDWQERLRAGHFTVYEAVQPRRPFCGWCVCREVDDRRRGTGDGLGLFVPLPGFALTDYATPLP